jgi:hypothetical protein
LKILEILEILGILEILSEIDTFGDIDTQVDSWHLGWQSTLVLTVDTWVDSRVSEE